MCTGHVQSVCFVIIFQIKAGSHLPSIDTAGGIISNLEMTNYIGRCENVCRLCTTNLCAIL